MKLKEYMQPSSEWNMVGGYYELLYKLLHYYYDASLSPGLYDDIEALKRIIDHYQCKIIANSKLLKDNDQQIVNVLDERIKNVEKEYGDVSKRYAHDSVKKSSADLIRLSNAKRELREIHRTIMNCIQTIGDFDMRRKVNSKMDFLKDLGVGSEEE